MKIIHTADLHIGSPLTSRLPIDKREERQNELMSNFRRLVEEAYSLGAYTVMISGDLFDENAVSRRAKASFLETVRWASDISFFYLEGNHDEGIIEEAEKPENLFTFGKEWTYYELAEDVVITGRKYFNGRLFDTLTLKKDKKNLVMLHGELRDRSAPRYTIGRKDAEGKNIDYLALGHYHTYSATRIDERGVAVYCGTPEGRGFDEVGRCGFVLVDTGKKEVTHKFIPFAKREIHDIKLSIENTLGQSDIAKKARDILAEIPLCDIVRLELVGRYSPDIWKDEKALEGELSRGRYHLEIKDASLPRFDCSELKNDKSLKGEFIRLVLADRTLTEEEKEKVILLGISALLGEELKSL